MTPRSHKLRPSTFDRLARYVRPLDEVRGFDARLLVQLPVPTLIELVVDGWVGPVWLALAGASVHAAKGDPVLTGETWLLLVEAVDAGRAFAPDFRRVLSVLASGGSLSRADVLGPVETGPSRSLTVATVLERLGARVFSVRTDAEPLLAAHG